MPPHSLKKPAFAPDVTFEDLARLPFGHLEGYRSARSAGETDSTQVLALVPNAALSVLYASLEVTFTRNPAVLRRIAFAGNGVRPSKVMEITRYEAEPGGFFPAEIVFTGGEGLTSVRLLLTPLQGDVVRDKSFIPGEPPPGFAEPRWLPRDESGAGE
jgi:hypothetical protein